MGSCVHRKISTIKYTVLCISVMIAFIPDASREFGVYSHSLTLQKYRFSRIGLLRKIKILRHVILYKLITDTETCGYQLQNRHT